MLTKQTYNFKHILFPIYTYGKQFNLQTYNFMVLKGWDSNLITTLIEKQETVKAGMTDCRAAIVKGQCQCHQSKHHLKGMSNLYII